MAKLPETWQTLEDEEHWASSQRRLAACNRFTPVEKPGLPGGQRVWRACHPCRVAGLPATAASFVRSFGLLGQAGP
eukprot:2965097-Pyramimonas_sp.AAC.1